METFDTQLVLNGRITIPKEVRQKLRLKEGDHIRVQIKKLVLQEATA